MNDEFKIKNTMIIYIIGIGGAGTSALAKVYHEKGYSVSGSDVGDGFYTKYLAQLNIKAHTQFDAKNIPDNVDLVVYSTAIDDDNVELKEVQTRGVRVLTYPQAVGDVTHEMKTIAVCGTHGKTTTTALVAHGLIATKVKPTVIVGSHITAWGSGAYVGGDDVFVVEADEYQNKLALYDAHIVIVTSVDYDHPDYFPDEVSYKKVFADFVARVPEGGCVIACGDSETVREVVQGIQAEVIFYGTGDDNDYKIVTRETHEDGQIIHVEKAGEKFEIATKLYGEHNAKNALAAWIVAERVSGDVENATKGIGLCMGTARRFERRGELNGAVLIDDYAHHPEEITATLRAAREVFPEKRIVAAFHPHTFTRTKALLPEFAKSLDLADRVIVLDIYGSARESKGSISAEDLVDAVNNISEGKALYVPTITELAPWMQKELSENDAFFTLGAGDIWQVYDEIT